jgi:hypothetical protein
MLRIRRRLVDITTMGICSVGLFILVALTNSAG